MRAVAALCTLLALCASVVAENLTYVKFDVMLGKDGSQTNEGSFVVEARINTRRVCYFLLILRKELN